MVKKDRRELTFINICIDIGLIGSGAHMYGDKSDVNCSIINFCVYLIHCSQESRLTHMIKDCSLSGAKTREDRSCYDVMYIGNKQHGPN